MKPIDFENSNVKLAKNQKEYKTLPAYRAPDSAHGAVLSVWKPTQKERQQILNGENIGVWTWTHGNPFQPLRVVLSKEKER